MCPLPPFGKKPTRKAKQEAAPWKDIPIDEVHYFDNTKPKPPKQTPKQIPSESEKKRMCWDLKGVLILPPDDPRVQEALEFQKRFFYTKEEAALFPDNPTEE